MEILGKILGTPARVKIMRLFLLNKSKNFTTKDIAKRSRVTPEAARKEVRLLESVTFIRRKGDGYSFNYDFKYSREIEGLLITSNTVDKDSILEHFKKAGKIKLLIAAGIFIRNKDSRADLLIIGDRMKKSQIEEGVRKLEAEIGTELTYAVFETKEFIYRLSMYDKLVRDILDFPHEVLIQAKELSTQALKRP